MMAFHPAQVAIVNHGFTPTQEEVAHARAVVAAFATNSGEGALKLEGKMIDRQHLMQAQRILRMGE